MSNSARQSQTPKFTSALLSIHLPTCILDCQLDLVNIAGSVTKAASERGNRSCGVHAAERESVRYVVIVNKNLHLQDILTELQGLGRGRRRTYKDRWQARRYSTLLLFRYATLS